MGDGRRDRGPRKTQPSSVTSPREPRKVPALAVPAAVGWAGVGLLRHLPAGSSFRIPRGNSGERVEDGPEAAAARGPGGWEIPAGRVEAPPVLSRR